MLITTPVAKSAAILLAAVNGYTTMVMPATTLGTDATAWIHTIVSWVVRDTGAE